ncbi:MAG: acyl-CoA thioesterase [Anaerolineae bacterium]|nr:acyl-CoA thioesterase [Anaerolineae bacterium]
MTTRVRVRYAETDAQGVAYHSNYLIWFEVGRSEYFRQVVGDSPAEFFRRYGMPVVEARVRYRAPCRYDDELVIFTQASQVRSRSIRFDYVISLCDVPSTLVAEGHTVHLCVDSSGAPCRIPDEVRLPLVERLPG